MTGRFLGVLLAMGCGRVHVDGEVGGEKPILRDAYFVQEDDQFDGGDGVILLVLSGIADACAVDEELYDQIGDIDDASDAEDAWQELRPEDYWQVEVTLRVGDPDDDLAGASFQGV